MAATTENARESGKETRKKKKQEHKSERRGKETDCASRNTEQVCLVQKKVWQNKK